MPVQYVEIPDITDTIHKNVIHSVVERILAMTGIDDKDITYYSDYNNMYQPESDRVEDNKLSFGNRASTWVNVDEQRDPENKIVRAVGYDYSPPFFHDKRYGIKLAPSPVKYDVTVTLNRKDKSRSLVENWFNDIRRRIDMAGEVMLTQADYHYAIPPACLNLLGSLYKTSMPNNPNPDETLVEFLRNGFAEAVTVITDEVGNNKTYAVRNTLTRIQALVDTEDLKEEKWENNTAWVGEFVFKFSYSRPETVLMSYPAVLNNTIIEEEWWPPQEVKGLSDERDAIKGVYVDAQDKILEEHPMVALPIYIPACDRPDLNVGDRDVNEVDLVIGHLIFDEDDIAKDPPYFCCNLRDLGISDTVTDYLQKSYCENPHGRDSIIRTTVFDNQLQLGRESVAIDCDLNIWINHNIRLDHAYRFTFTIKLNWGFVTDPGYDHLRQSPEFVNAVLKDFRPELVEKYPEIGDDEIEVIEPEILDPLVTDMITDPNHPYYKPENSFHGYQLNILNGRIIAHKE